MYIVVVCCNCVNYFYVLVVCTIYIQVLCFSGIFKFYVLVVYTSCMY